MCVFNYGWVNLTIHCCTLCYTYAYVCRTCRSTVVVKRSRTPRGVQHIDIFRRHRQSDVFIVRDGRLTCGSSHCNLIRYEANSVCISSRSYRRPPLHIYIHIYLPMYVCIIQLCVAGWPNKCHWTLTTLYIAHAKPDHCLFKMAAVCSIFTLFYCRLVMFNGLRLVCF